MLAALLLALAPAAPAADRVWSIRGEDRGLPVGTVTAVGSDAQGLLWVGTQAGLARFDGDRFTAVGAADFSGWVEDLAPLPEGGMLVAGQGGPVAGAAECTAGATRCRAARSPWEVCVDGDGAQWAADGTALWRRAEGSWEPVAVPQDARPRRLRCAGAQVFLLGFHGAWERRGAGWELLATMDYRPEDVVVGPQGARWVLPWKGPLLRVDGPSRTELALPEGEHTDLQWRGDWLWAAGTAGLVGLGPGGRVERIGREDGLPYGGPLALDREQGLWMGTRRGLLLFSEPEAAHYDEDDGARRPGRAARGLGRPAGLGLGLARLLQPRSRGRACPRPGRAGGGLRPRRPHVGHGPAGPSRRAHAARQPAHPQRERRDNGEPGHSRHPRPQHGLRCRGPALDPQRHRALPHRRGRAGGGAAAARLPRRAARAGAGALVDAGRPGLSAGWGSLGLHHRGGRERHLRRGRVGGRAGLARDDRPGRSGAARGAAGGAGRSGGGARAESGAPDPLSAGRRLADRPGAHGAGLVGAAAGRSSETLDAWRGLDHFSLAEVLELPDGTIWAATWASLMELPPSARDRPVPVPALILDELRGEQGLLEPEGLVLSWRDNRLLVRLAALTYRARGALRVRVRTGEQEPWLVQDHPHLSLAGLSAGAHQLEAQASLDGQHWSPSVVLAFEVTRAPWLRWWAWLLYGGLLLGVGLGVHHLRLQRALRLHRERERIALELHDELGGGITSVGVGAGLLGSDRLPPQVRREVSERLAREAGQMGSALTDIVWSLKTGPLTAQELVDHLADRARTLLLGAGCELVVEGPTAAQAQTRLSPELARALLLVGMEALHNAARHAQASEVMLRLRIDSGLCTLEIQDNGVGLDAPSAQPGGGMGMESARRRAQRGGGRLELHRLSRGTLVHLQLPLHGVRPT